MGVAVSGELGGIWKLQGGTVSPILTGMTVRNWGVTFDLSGNFVQAREAVEAGDTHRIILRAPNGSVVDDSLVTQVVGPCATAFARDASGATTKQLVIAQTDGTLLRANAAGIASWRSCAWGGWRGAAGMAAPPVRSQEPW